MGYTIKQKIEICLQSEANPQMTQMDLATWAMRQYGSPIPPSQTTISRILSSKNDILGTKEADFQLVRRRKATNPLLRDVLTEWIAQATWEKIPITTPIVQSTANAIWTKLPTYSKDGNGVFSHKWCNHFVKKLNANLTGSAEAIEANMGFPLNKIWKLDEKVELKGYIEWLISKYNYSPKDLFTIDEFSLFHFLPLDQIFDVSSIDKGLSQSNKPSENMVTVLSGCNMDGSEKLMPLVISNMETFDVSASTHPAFKAHANGGQLSPHNLTNKISEVYQIYHKSNKNKWVTSSIFQDYLLSLDHKIESVTPDREVLIFLDESSSHRIINLEFKHIRLVYMDNSSKHKNPYNGSFNGVKFDYIPMSFGIIEEFKILYRLQQYLDMINKQRNVKSGDFSQLSVLETSKLPANDTGSTNILSEADYHVPLIKAIEWIKRAWDSISPEKIFTAWRRSHLVSFKKPWPASDLQVVENAARTLRPLMDAERLYDPRQSFSKLRETMAYLNVVIPWEIEDLLGLVNERIKVNLLYVSIDEMIDSCATSCKEDETTGKTGDAKLDQIVNSQANWINSATAPASFPTFRGISPALPEPMSPKVFSPPKYAFEEKLPSMSVPVITDYDRLSGYGKAADYPATGARNTEFPKTTEYPGNGSRGLSMDALLLATNTKADLKATLNPMPAEAGDTYGKHKIECDTSERKRQSVEPSSYDPAPQFNGMTPILGLCQPPSYDNEVLRYSAPVIKNGRVDDSETMDEELIGVLSKVIEASKNNGLKLSSFTLDELKLNLHTLQKRSDQRSISTCLSTN